MTTSHGRLRWRCRRGLKELDVFFEAFVANGLDDLPEALYPALERFLALQDQDILAALLGDESRIAERSGDEGVDICRRIRACLHTETGD